MNVAQAPDTNENILQLFLTIITLTFTGPRIAAVSNIWYTYHWLSGRYPWATEKVLKKYGDVIRIAPNELLFFTPEAFTGQFEKNIGLADKLDINDRGDKHGGLGFERDAVRHRNVSKQVAPASSPKSTRAKEPRVHKYIDTFVSKMRTHGSGVKNSSFLDVLLGFNAYTTIEQVSKRFLILGKLKYVFIPFSRIQSMKDMNQTSREQLHRRIEKKGNTEHLDLFEQLVPPGRTVPSDPDEFRHLEQVATQLLFAGFEPVSSWIYSTLFQLAKHPNCLDILTAEIRGAFDHYDDILSSALAKLEYLNACLEESMRLLPSNNTGLPRVSPGATIDKTYVPLGVTVQTSMFATTRSARFFRDPARFNPQRWLNEQHPIDVFPFSQGPRQCPGKNIAWMQVRLFVGKVLWTFDMNQVPGTELDFERDLITYGFWVKPELRINFIEKQREP
ncbi:cytochrome P450 [Xylaria digitata]|nr:cytochrome P450 [Xylaria digitata]